MVPPPESYFWVFRVFPGSPNYSLFFECTYWFLVPNCLFRFSFYWLLFPILNSGHLVSEVGVGSRPLWKRIFICWKKIATGRSGRGPVGTACAFPGPGTYSPGLWLWDVHPPLCLSWDHPELLGQWPALPHQWNSIPHSPAFPPWPHVPSLWFHLLSVLEDLLVPRLHLTIWSTLWGKGTVKLSRCMLPSFPQELKQIGGENNYQSIFFV